MSYKTIAQGFDRRFEISGGLRAGYAGTGPTYTLEDVITAHGLWQNTVKRVLGVMIASATAAYGAPYPYGINQACEPGFILSGSINVLYDADLPTRDAHDLIRSLASFLANHLGQERIYYVFADEAFILERA